MDEEEEMDDAMKKVVYLSSESFQQFRRDDTNEPLPHGLKLLPDCPHHHKHGVQPAHRRKESPTDHTPSSQQWSPDILLHALRGHWDLGSTRNEINKDRF